MALLVVGSVALDTITTPLGKVEETLGGSAVYFSLGAGSFDVVKTVGVVGPDFPVSEKRFLAERRIDIRGLTTGQGPTFRWEGVYGPDFGDVRTIRTELGVFASFQPKLPEDYVNTPYVFLANIDPVLQLDVLDQVQHPRWVAVDTMKLWIDQQRENVLKVFERVDIVIVNVSEALMLSRKTNLFDAAAFINDIGPRYAVIKMGPAGAMIFGGEIPFILPAYPLEQVVDPTGAGDTFASGLLGYLSGSDSSLDFESMKKGLAYGSVNASFACSGFGVENLREIDRDEIDSRMEYYLSTNQLREVKI
ncbi:MAG: sugar kinase [Candidatus Aegiribacteria sp.]|nr:sugar kinase [Candidatus Aegiribacteria sp.]MBD3295231.1 sugar kinase [Candidatus Fermentibacteria bacterium]